MTAVWRRGSWLLAMSLLAALSPLAHGASTAATTGTRAVTASSTAGQVKISGWATFSGVNIAAGTDPANDAMPAGQADRVGTDLIGAQLVYRPELADLYMRWQVHKIPSTGGAVVNVVGAPGTVYVLRTEIANVPIEIRAQSYGPTQTYQLYKGLNEGPYTFAGNLTGAFGTTGEEVIVDIPLSTLASLSLPLKEGDTIGAPRAYTYVAPDPTSQLPESVSADFISMAKTARVLVPAKKVSVTVGQTTKVAALDKGYFTAYLPRSAFKRNPSPVTTRTCLGPTCVNQTFTVRY